MIRFGCPACRAILRVPEHLANAKVTCSSCGQRVVVPPLETGYARNRTLPGVRMPVHDLPPTPAALPSSMPHQQRQGGNPLGISCVLAAVVLVFGFVVVSGAGVGLWLWLKSDSSITAAAPKKTDTSPKKNEAPVKLTGQQVYDKVLKSAVWINNPGVGSGTGVLINAEKKLVLTNYHVVLRSPAAKNAGFDDLGQKAAPYVTVNFPEYKDGQVITDKRHYQKVAADDGEKCKGKVVALSEAKDLAIVKLNYVPAGVAAVPLAKDGGRPGQTVHSIGNPGGSGVLWVYTSGTVRTAPYDKQWLSSGPNGMVLNISARVIETQSPTNPGDSGGPLLNEAGELVAVTQGVILGANAINLFIDVAEVRDLLEALTPSTPAGEQFAVKLYVPAKVGQVRQVSVTLTKTETVKKPGEAAATTKTLKAALKGRLVSQTVTADGKTATGELTIEHWSAEDQGGPLTSLQTGDVVAFELIGRQHQYRTPANRVVSKELATALASMADVGLNETGDDELWVAPADKKAVGTSWNLDPQLFAERFNQLSLLQVKPHGVSWKFTLAALSQHKGAKFLDIKGETRIDLDMAEFKNQPPNNLRGFIDVKLLWRLPADFATGPDLRTQTISSDVEAGGASSRNSQFVEAKVSYPGG